jgi:hypothetical protein
MGRAQVQVLSEVILSGTRVHSATRLDARFAPRLRDIRERRLYLLPGVIADPITARLVGSAIDITRMQAHHCRGSRHLFVPAP